MPNQLNALRILHDLAKPRGLIYSFFPRGGNMDHGLLHYTDRFVDLLCEANCYQTVSRSDENSTGNQCTWIVMRKTSDAPFEPPVDVQLGESFPMAERPKPRKWSLTGWLGG